MTQVESKDTQVRGTAILFRGAMNASAAALDTGLNEEELTKLANANMAVRDAVRKLTDVANEVACSAFKRKLRG